MRYGIISDIHSNLEALQVVLESLEGMAVDEIICAGDIVGYNANPNECIDLIREHSVRSIMGNHEARVLSIKDLSLFTPDAAAAIEWTQKNITTESLEYLRSLPESITIDGLFKVIHGSLKSYDSYISGKWTPTESLLSIKDSGEVPICLFGHTHIQGAFVLDNGAARSIDGDFEIGGDSYYLINPGGLGQPRDRDDRAPFCVLDLCEDGDGGSVNFHRSPYDIEKTTEKIRAAKLPAYLAERLLIGR